MFGRGWWLFMEDGAMYDGRDGCGAGDEMVNKEALVARRGVRRQDRAGSREYVSWPALVFVFL